MTTDDYFTRATGPHCSLPTRPTTQKRVFWIPRVFFYKIKLFKSRTAAKASCFSQLNSPKSRLSTWDVPRRYVICRNQKLPIQSNCVRLFLVYQSIKIICALFNIDCSTSPARLHSTSVAVLRCVSCSFPWMTFAASASWRASTRVSPSTGVVPRRVLQRSRCCTTPRTYASCCTNLSCGHFVITRWIYRDPIRFLDLNYICIHSSLRSLPKNPDAIVLSKIFAIWNVAWLCSQRSSWITLSKSVIPHSSMPLRIWMIVWRFCFCSAHFPHYIWYHVNSRIFADD